MHGIIDNEENIAYGKFNFDVLAVRFSHWITSDPFDIGQTTTRGLEPLEDDPRAEASWTAATKCNQFSLSNGSLMRCTPMAVFTSGGISPENIRTLISGDVLFTHSNPIVHDSIFCYCTTIHYLLSHPNEPNRA